MKLNRQRWLIAIVVSVIVHAVFCIQAVSVARQGGLVSNVPFGFAFLPQEFLMFFLPPAWPLHFNADRWSWDVNWWGVAGKLAVAYPASLGYGLAAGAGWFFFRRKTAH